MLSKTIVYQSTPEAQGIASAAILAFLDGVEQAQLGLHSMILVRHGQAVAKGWWSPYAADLPHMLFSLRHPRPVLFVDHSAIAAGG